ncbi:hypothetical protein ACJJTC_019725 [Scirpophaga incertulas]
MLNTRQVIPLWEYLHMFAEDVQLIESLGFIVDVILEEGQVVLLWRPYSARCGCGRRQIDNPEVETFGSNDVPVSAILCRSGLAFAALSSALFATCYACLLYADRHQKLYWATKAFELHAWCGLPEFERIHKATIIL